VYNKNEDGSFQLVAAEYAVPIDISPNKAPEGFTGTGDVWDRNTGLVCGFCMHGFGKTILTEFLILPIRWCI